MNVCSAAINIHRRSFYMKIEVIKFAKVSRPVPKTPLEHKIKDGECDDADAEKD